MKAGEVRCRLCGQQSHQAAERGAWLERVNRKGEVPMVVECRPSCNDNPGVDPLAGAIEGGWRSPPKD